MRGTDRDQMRWRVAKVMRAAQDVLGSREDLAQQLKVAPHVVGEWIAGIGDAPEAAFYRAVEIILNQRGLRKGQ
jgi:hypothetical protein